MRVRGHLKRHGLRRSVELRWWLFFWSDGVFGRIRIRRSTREWRRWPVRSSISRTRSFSSWTNEIVTAPRGHTSITTAAAMIWRWCMLRCLRRISVIPRWSFTFRLPGVARRIIWGLVPIEEPPAMVECFTPTDPRAVARRAERQSLLQPAPHSEASTYHGHAPFPRHRRTMDRCVCRMLC